MVHFRDYNVFLIFFGGLFLFTVGLSHQEIISFETRFYLFALEMWRNGVTWFPTTYHQPYPDYPVTSTLCIYWVSRLFGELNKFTAVFPSACASAITLAVTYLIGASRDRLWGWLAVFFLLLTNTFFMEARTISLDQYTTAITVICFYLAQKNKQQWLIFLLLILGFAFRGPIGLVIPTGVVCISYLLDKNYKQFLMTGFLAALLLVICSAGLLALAYHTGGMPFMQDVLQMEVLGRMQEARTPPVYFYFIENIGAYAITYPIMLIILFGLGAKLAKLDVSPDLKLVQKLFAWTLLILIGLSLPADKKVRYVLSAAPAMALICAYVFAVLKAKKYFTYAWLVIIIAAFLFVISYISIVEPINLRLNKTHDFVMQVEKLRHKENAKLVFYQMHKDGLPIKYIANMSQDELPIFLNKPEDFSNIKNPAFFIMTTESADQLPKNIKNKLHVISNGKLGHEAVVVSQVSL